MRFLLNTTLALTLMGLSTVTAPAQTTTDDQATRPTREQRQERRQKMMRFHEDLDRAIANANLTEAERAKLRTALTTMKEARQRHRAGEQVDREQMRAAMQEIRSFVQGDAIRAEDKAALQQHFAGRRGMRGQGHHGNPGEARP